MRDFSYRRVEGNPTDDRLKELLVGKSITKVDSTQGLLYLSDGMTLMVDGNEGCGGCTSGVYWLAELNECDNVITNVETTIESVAGDDKWSDVTAYKIFVYADNKKVNVATFEGDDGNGYYGTGWWMVVKGNNNDEK